MKNTPTTTGRGTSYLLSILGRKWYSIPLILLLLAPMTLTAQESSTYTFNFRNSPYENVFKQVGEQTGYNFFYSNTDLQKLKPLTLSVSNVDLNTLLSKLFSGTGLSYEVKSNKTIVVKANPEPLLTSAPVAKQEPEHKTVSGTAIDASDRKPIPFVSITAKEVPNFHAMTDENGKFSFALPDNAKTLVFDFIGYDIQEVFVGKQSTFSVVLNPTALALDEAVSIGYQTRKKSTLTGSVKALDGAVIQSKPVASFDKALQGQVAGVYIMSSGAPGGSSNMLIRGVTSFDYSSPPLYILDGTPISPTNFASLNPNDIDQYTVLKDASATSIYGSLAANGVVLLTSKRGKNMDRAEVSYRFQIGTSMLTGQNFTMMNTAQRLPYEEQIGIRELDATGKLYLYRDKDGNIIRTESKDSLMRINTNWHDEIYRNGLIQSHEVAIRGGSEKTRYYTSLSYFGQGGILPSSDFKRFAFRINLDQEVSKFFKVGTSTALSREFRHSVPMPSGEIINPVIASYMLPPYLQPYNEDGELVEFQNTPFRNPLLYYSRSDMSNSRVKLVTNVYGELKLLPFLTFKTSLGYDYQNLTSYTFTSPEADGGSISRGYVDDQSLTNTNLFTFKQQIADKHSLTVLLGEEYLSSQDSKFSVYGSGLSNDKVHALTNASVISVTPNSDSYSRWVTLSFFSQASYNFDNRYFLDLSLRRDGSSRFGSENKWGTFWSVGASWNAKREKFLENSKVISALNVFASTGTSGNSNVGTYATYEAYMYGGGYSYNGEIGSGPSSPGNPSLTWETVLKNNLGAEITLYNKYRIKLETYINKTSNMLFMDNLSLTSGFSERQSNIGGMKNSGVELELDLTLLKTNDVFWKINGNVSYTKTKMTDISESLETGLLIYENNKTFGSFYLSRYAGVDPLNGAPLWYDVNGNITSTYSTANRVRLDKSFIPKYTGGFGSDFSYKNLSLSVFFSWVGPKYMMNNLSKFYDSNGNIKDYNQSTDMLKYWKNVGDVTPYPNPSYASSQDDTRYLENASFLRLKNIMISYTLDPEYLKKTKLIRSARVYFQAQNLLTFTSYRGFDPENIAPVEGNIYPQAKSFTLGLDLTF